ncbi:MAG: hypothetical protein ACTHKG_05270 [Nocardioides sp.]
MTQTRDQAETAQQRRRHQAGAFDIRMIIAMLIGIYGVVLVLAGFLGTSDADLRRAGGMNVNLSAGIGMVVVAALFALWARLRPVAVPDEVEQDDE